MTDCLTIIKEASIASALWRAGKLGLGTGFAYMTAQGIRQGANAISGGTEDVMDGNYAKGAKRIAGGAGLSALNASYLGGKSLIGAGAKRIGVRPAGIVGSTALGVGEMAGDMYAYGALEDMTGANQEEEKSTQPKPQPYNIRPQRSALPQLSRR